MAIRSLITKSYKEWRGVSCQMAAAALSFFTLFSLTPFFVLLSSAAQWLGQPVTQQKRFLREISSIIGGDQGAVVRGWLGSLAISGDKPMIYSLIFIMLGTASVFVNLERAFDHIWIDPTRSKKGWKSVVRSRLFSAVMTLFVTVTLMAFFLAQAVLNVLHSLMGGLIPRTMFWSGTQYMISVALLTVLFSAIYKWAPSVQMRWRDAFFGGGVTAILLSTGRTVLRLYFTARPVGLIYGPAAWAIVIPIWIYFSWEIILFGAQLTLQYMRWADGE